MNNRRKIIAIIDKRKSIHFTCNVGAINSDANLWFKFDDGKTLFTNIEQILVGIGEAHNVTDITLLNNNYHEDGYSDVEIIYNKKEV
jgi:hypothetical protein